MKGYYSKKLQKNSKLYAELQENIKLYINHSINKESKQKSLFKDLKKEVDTGANGTQKYVIKKGENKGKVADINAIGNNNK